MSRFEIPPVGLQARSSWSGAPSGALRPPSGTPAPAAPEAPPPTDAERVIAWARTVARSVPFRGHARLAVHAGACWELFVLPGGTVQAVYRDRAMAHSFQAQTAPALAARVAPAVLAELAARIADGRVWRDLPAV